MSNYSCEKCGKEYKQKGHYERHINNIKSCIIDDKLKEDNNVDDENTKKPKVLKTKKVKKIEEDIKEDDQDNKEEVKKEVIETLHLKPMIKWSGGKSDEIKNFEKYFPEKYDTYLEPFIGGGSVYFYLNPKKSVISDVHKELIAFYKSIKNGKMKDIYDFMEITPNEEERYYKVRDEMDYENELENAKRFYYLRKTCFRGMMRYNRNGKFNIPFGRYKTLNYAELENVNYEELLKRTTVLNESFEYVFEKYNDSNNFMFLDQPYDSTFTDYGYCKFGPDEQKALAKCFKETKIKCLMIVGKTELITELYKDYIVSEYHKKYKFKIHSGRVDDKINTTHLIIKNY